jgi:hypothetical protein
MSKRLHPTPTPLFLQKRLQPIENKGWKVAKESQETQRGRKLLKAREL